MDEKNLNDENEELNAEYENNDGYFDNYNALNKNTNVYILFILYIFFRISELVQVIIMLKTNLTKENMMRERISKVNKKTKNKKNQKMVQISNRIKLITQIIKNNKRSKFDF